MGAAVARSVCKAVAIRQAFQELCRQADFARQKRGGSGDIFRSLLALPGLGLIKVISPTVYIQNVNNTSLEDVGISVVDTQ